MATAITSASYPILSDPRLKGMRDKLKMLAGQQAVGKGDKIYKQKSTDDIVWDVPFMQGIGPMEYIQEMQDAPADQPREDYRITRAVWFHGRATVVSEFALKKSDRLKSIIIESLAKSPELTNEAWYQAHYDNSLSGVTVPTVGGRAIVDNKAFDGLSYFNASHTWKGTNITNSNLSAPLRSWSHSSMSSMIKQAKGWKTDKGYPMQPKAKAWIVGDDLVGVANSFNKSEKDPETNINQPNTVRLENQGGPVQDVIHWSYMGTDEFMLEFETPVEEVYGLCHTFLKGYKAKTNEYAATNSGTAVVFDIKQVSQVYGDWPYAYITNRAAV